MPNTLGERFKRFIEMEGVKKEQLADLLGVKPSTISDWMRNKTRPRIENIFKLKELYPDLNTDYLLFGGSQSMKNSVSNTEDYKEKLIKAQEQLIEELRKQIPNNEGNQKSLKLA